MCTLDGQQGCDGNVLMQQIYRIGECSKGQWAAWHRDPATIKSQPTPGLEKCRCKEKNKTVDATGNEQGAPALHPNPHSLSFLLSLSLTWDCKPLAHCSKDHEAPHRQHDLHIFPRITASREPRNATNPAEGAEEKKTEQRAAGMMAKLDGKCAKHLTTRVFSSLPPFSLSLCSLALLSSGRYGRITISEWWKMNHNLEAYGGDNRYRPGDWSVRR